MTQEEINRGYLLEGGVWSIVTKEISIPRLDQVSNVFIFTSSAGSTYADIAQLCTGGIKKMFDSKLWIVTDRKQKPMSMFRSFRLSRRFSENMKVNSSMEFYSWFWAIKILTYIWRRLPTSAASRRTFRSIKGATPSQRLWCKDSIKPKTLFNL